MEIHCTILIDAPATEAWSVLGEHFASIGDWAASITASSLDGALGVGATRTCSSKGFGPFPGGEFSEVLTHFDPKSMAFSYRAVTGMPWFVSRAQNRWTVEALRENQCCVHSRATLELLWWMRPLGPILQRMMRASLRGFTEELQYRVLHGSAHPRKLGTSS